MSITFFFSGDTQSTTHYNCMFCEPGAPTPGCPECNGTGQVTLTNDDHAVNLSNHNAWLIADSIGWRDFDYAGEMPALDFLELVSRTNYESDCYFLNKQRQLVLLGIAAARVNEPVRWG